MKQFLKHLYCSVFHKASFKMMDNGCLVSCVKCKYSEAVLFLVIAIPFMIAAVSTWTKAEETVIPIMRINMNLEVADDPAGPWTATTNLYTFVVIEDPQKFYRVRLEGMRFR